MTWEFNVIALTQQRLFSRILQILEGQMVNVHSFRGETNGEHTTVTLLCSSAQNKAYRIEALLYRLEGVRNVSGSVVEQKATEMPNTSR